MMEIFFTRKYQRALVKLVKKRPDYIRIIEKRIDLLKHSPVHPMLRVHKLVNRDEYSLSIDHSIRIIFSREKDTCYLLEIGSHDEVY